MATEWEKLLEIAQGSRAAEENGQAVTPSTAGSDIGRNAKADVNALAPKPNVDPSKITQSYYTTPTNATNYETGRPVYTQSQAVKDAAAALEAHRGNKPGEYVSTYGDQIQSLIDKALNRPSFTYDFAADPIYQMYADQYQTKGQMAMKGAMGESAALTGGYGNSYAQQAGQQAYQTYLLDLNNMIPQLRQQAYEQYQDEGNTLRANLGILQQQDATDYDRYRDTVGDWQSELNYLYTLYGDMSQQEYQRYMNDAGAWEADRAYWYQKAYDAQQQANWEAEFNAKYGGRSGRGGGGGRSGGSSVSLSSTTRQGAAKELNRLVQQGSVKAGSAEYDKLVTQVSKKPAASAQQERKRMSGYTR